MMRSATASERFEFSATTQATKRSSRLRTATRSDRAVSGLSAADKGAESVTHYHRLSASEKERYARDRLREPAVRCPRCEAALQPEDLISHCDRCDGPRPPHPRSKWIGLPDAMALGASRVTVRRWVKSGRVRARGSRGSRRYLLRDVARLVAMSRYLGRDASSRRMSVAASIASQLALPFDRGSIDA